jgi:hypothetical protein
MIITTTEVFSFCGLSTANNSSYIIDIEYYIPIITEEISDIANHRFRDSYHWLYDCGLIFASSNKTITLSSNSTESFLMEYASGDTIDIFDSYLNNGYKTVSSITSSHILIVNETLENEKSTEYNNLKTYIYKCFFPNYLKKIASKMVLYSIQNMNIFNGDIASESLGGYSRSYRVNDARSYGLYPINLISGIKKKTGSW